MKNSKQCAKCTSDDIVMIPGNSWFRESNIITIGLSLIPVTRYMCAQCGYSEEWVESKRDRIILKTKFKEK